MYLEGMCIYEGGFIMEESIKIYSKSDRLLSVKITPGHFATNHSHINYYIDMTMLKSRQSMAAAAAKAIVREYVTSTIVDTIVCMDGTEVIGAYLASELSAAGFMSMNAHQTIYVVSPEVNSMGQLVFRDNLQPMIKDKHVLLLLATATTGRTIQRALECIEYYGGSVAGVSALFSAVDDINKNKIHSIFKSEDFPEYQTYAHSECPFCKSGQKLDAIVNSYGYMKL